MDDHIAVVFHGGPLSGRLDSIPATGRPHDVDLRDGGWALYSLSTEYDAGRRVMQYQHGSDDAPQPAATGLAHR